MTQRFDAFMLLHTQRFADWFHRMTGLTTFWLQKVAAILWVSFVAAAWFNDADRGAFATVVAVGIQIAGMCYLAMIAWQEDQYIKHGRLYHNLVAEYHNRATLAIMLLILCIVHSFFAVLAHDLQNALFFGGDLSYLLLSYFLSCSPRPPGRSRQRELRNRLLRRLRATVDSAAEPAAA